jgi:uncharacterized protein (DUF1697 family)
MNAKMPDLKRAFESAGFTDVRTLLSSGNVVFTAARRAPAALERHIEAVLGAKLGTPFLTMVRSVDQLRALLAADPFQAFRVPSGAKRVVTFLRKPPGKVALPPTRDGARILAVRGTEAFTIYERTPKGPVFMTLIDKTFGKEQTTRTWETVAKIAK